MFDTYRNDLPRLAWTVLIAGAFATIAFDLFGKGLAPFFGFAKLAPVPLANQVLRTVFGSVPSGTADILHLLTGLVAYPLGYLLIARPLAARILPGLHWTVVSALYGAGLWVFALYGMAHLIAGNPPFLGFTGITWVALWGHVLFGVVAAAVIETRLPQPMQNAVPA